MDQSICGLHPGVAVTGFCSACLRERLAGLNRSSNPEPSELRRCKSFSYARSAAAYFEPQRRSCDTRAAAAALFAHQEPSYCLPDGEIGGSTEMNWPMKERIGQESSSGKTGTFGSLGKKWQEWRRKSKLKKQENQVPVTSRAAAAAMPMPPKNPRHRASFREHAQSEVASTDALGRRSVDVNARLSVDAGRVSVDEPRASWSVLGHLPAMMSLVEDVPVPRADGQIPVEDDGGEPGGCAQTRDYYLDSSSSSRRRRSLDRLSVSSRKSFSDASELPRMVAGANANSRVSPAIGAEFYQYHHVQSVLDHNQQNYDQGLPNSYPRRYDDVSGSLEYSAAFQDHSSNGVPLPPKNKSKKWIKGIWGLIHKKSSGTKESEAASVAGRSSISETAWPELRARGYNGQMLRCNSSVSARSSFGATNGAPIGSVSARRSNVEMHHGNVGLGGRMMMKDEVLLERNFSARYYPPCTIDNGVNLNPMEDGSQFNGRYQNGMSRKGRPGRSSNSLSRSTLGLY